MEELKAMIEAVHKDVKELRAEVNMIIDSEHIRNQELVLIRKQVERNRSTISSLHKAVRAIKCAK